VISMRDISAAFDQEAIAAQVSPAA
jgi:hypothetical protein